MGESAAQGMTSAQAVLRWLLAQDGVIVIPKTRAPKGLEDNIAALDAMLTPGQFDELDRLFSPPKGRTSLGSLQTPPENDWLCFPGLFFMPPLQPDDAHFSAR